MHSITAFTNYLNKNKSPLAGKIVTSVLEKMNLSIPEWEKQQAVDMYIEFLEFLISKLQGNEETVPEDIIAWSKKNGEREATSEGKISEIIRRYLPTREVFADIMINLAIEHQLSVKETSYIMKNVHYLLDISVNETVFAFERLSEEMLRENQKEMAELSAPVVPLQDKTAILPLIGNIDSYRAAYILEKAVPKIAELDIEILIADFSGMKTIDMEIATYLYSIENVLRLIGVKTIVTGLRPELAQTVVRAGIDMSAIQTFAHVKQALESIKK